MNGRHCSKKGHLAIFSLLTSNYPELERDVKCLVQEWFMIVSFMVLVL